MIAIGQDLKRERELRGISLEEIADSTKINIRFLHALENDQLEILPEKFFVRAIIREYAKYLGLEESDVLNKYQEAFRDERQAKDDKQQPGPGLPRNIKSTIQIAALGAFLIAVLIGLFFIFGNNQSPDVADETAPQKTMPKQVIAPVKPAEIPEKVEEKAEELVLEFFFRQDTWIQIFADGEKIYSGIRLQGGDYQVKAKEEIILDLGNAGGLSYTINGEEGIPFGKPGSVEKNIRITINNYKQFLSADDESEETDSARDIPQGLPRENSETAGR